MNFLDELAGRAAVSPDAVALVEPGGPSITFADLENRIDAIARVLRNAQIGRSDVVAAILPDGAGLMAGFLGVASTATCAILNPALRRAEIACALADLAARAVIVDPRTGSPAADVARERGIAVLDLESCPASARQLDPPAGRDTALLLHTSATTGKARVVALTHSNLRAMAANTRGILELTAEDRFLSMMPLFHLQGLLSSLAQLLAGGSVVCTAGFEADAFLSWLEDYHPTWYTAGPALHHAILPLIESRPDVLHRSPLRFVRSIGAALPHALMHQLEDTLHAPVLEGYGMTEAGAITSNTPRRRKPGSVGVSTGSEIGILDESGRFLPPEAEGEIVVRGPAVMHCYRNNPAANQSAFHDGWLRTGDLGRLDAEGFLFVTGRIKEMINRGGEKILPGEIEDALMSHPSVLEAVAFGVPHPTLGEEAMAAVVLRTGAPVPEIKLRGFVAGRVAEFKRPRRIISLSSIPKGATGKASRASLAEMLKAELDVVPDGPAAQGELETKLAQIWQRILKIDHVGPRDDFFQLGGDSLALTLVMAEVDSEFGASEDDEFLSSPTIETLTRLVKRSSDKRSTLLALQPNGDRIPFFCIPGADENPYYFLDLAKGLGPDQPFLVVRDPRPLLDRGIYTMEQHAALFCSAIRSMRPEGPYILGGHCYGGILAFEAARQLVASGQHVRLLVLFETPTPGYPKVARHWRKYLWHSMALGSSLLHGQVRSVGTQVRAHAGALKDLFRRKREAITRRALVSAGMQKMIAPGQRLDCQNEGVGRAYVPGPLACEVVHFLAADERHSTEILDDPRLGWRDVVGSRFSVCKVPGIADGVFKPPAVTELASQLRDRLDHANQVAKGS
ncbi:MAG TPA: AMP-binding protein [Bryobacteraceae bacterium]|nr:AMP-binding protein [Bryobacteraceae bacterium]